MILTGLAKNDFLSWYGTGEHYFVTTLKSIEQYAHIVEWLDGVGLIIIIDYNGWSNTLEVSIAPSDPHIPVFKLDEKSEILILKLNEESFTSRQQATEAAIKLADKIYNNR